MEFKRGASKKNDEAKRGSNGSARAWAKHPEFRQGYIDAQFGKRAYRGSQEWTDYETKIQCECYEAGRFTAVFARTHGIKTPYWYDPKVVPKDITDLIYTLAGVAGSAFVLGKTRKG